MNRKTLRYALILIAVFAMVNDSRAYGANNNKVAISQSTSQSVYASSVNQYRTRLDINANQLNQSHRLTITGTGLSGAVRLNGRVLTTLRSNGTSINLAPYLSRGRHNLTISGPARGNVQMTFTGPGINLIHQASGSNWMDMELTLEVW